MSFCPDSLSPVATCRSIAPFTKDVSATVDSLQPQIRYHEALLLMPDNPMPSWFGFLRVEADLAMTFIGLAQVRLRPEYAARSLRNARKAVAQIERCLMDPTHYGLRVMSRWISWKSAIR